MLTGTASAEEMKEEAVRRLRSLRVMEKPVVKDFIQSGKIYRSEAFCMIWMRTPGKLFLCLNRNGITFLTRLSFRIRKLVRCTPSSLCLRIRRNGLENVRIQKMDSAMHMFTIQIHLFFQHLEELELKVLMAGWSELLKKIEITLNWR